jgi:hypothetical protein
MEVNLFAPHPGQLKIIEGFADSEHKFGIVSTGRQFGKSLLASNLLVYWLLENNNSKGAWISPIYNQSKKVFKEVVKACKDIVTNSNGSDLIINFVNGSSIQFLSAERYDSIRGFSFQYLIVDEAAFIKEEALNEAILPTLTAIGRKCLIISTPKGKGNWFFNWYTRGTYDNSTYISFKGISSDNPFTDTSFIEEQRKSLPPEIYKQEYLAEFTDSGNDVFVGLDLVCNLNTFDYDTRSERTVLFGIDTGLHSDFSVLTILSESGRVLAIERLNGSTFEQIGGEFVQRLKRFGSPLGYVETNGVGEAIYQIVSRHIRGTKPFVTTNESKTRMIRKLILDIQNGNLELPSKEFFPILYNELSSFTYKVNPNGTIQFGHPNGGHDDTVISLALANLAREEIVSTAKQFHVSGGPITNLKPKFGKISSL